MNAIICRKCGRLNYTIDVPCVCGNSFSRLKVLRRKFIVKLCTVTFVDVANRKVTIYKTW